MTVVPFSRKTNVMGPFISQRSVNMTFFTDCFTQNLSFYRRVSLLPLHGLSFRHRIVVSSFVFNPYANIFLDEIILLRTPHTSSVNFRWFALRSRQQSDDTSLFMPWSPLFDLRRFWIALKEIFLWDWNNFSYKPIPNIVSLHLWKKNNFSFFKKFYLFIQWPTYYFTHLGVFHTSVVWWFSTGVWVTASLIKSPKLFLVFWPILIMPQSRWFPLVLLLPNLPVSVPVLW